MERKKHVFRAEPITVSVPLPPFHTTRRDVSFRRCYFSISVLAFLCELPPMLIALSPGFGPGDVHGRNPRIHPRRKSKCQVGHWTSSASMEPRCLSLDRRFVFTSGFIGSIHGIRMFCGFAENQTGKENAPARFSRPRGLDNNCGRIASDRRERIETDRTTLLSPPRSNVDTLLLDNAAVSESS